MPPLSPKINRFSGTPIDNPSGGEGDFFETKIRSCRATKIYKNNEYIFGAWCLLRIASQIKANPQPFKCDLTAPVLSFLPSASSDGSAKGCLQLFNDWGQLWWQLVTIRGDFVWDGRIRWRISNPNKMWKLKVGDEQPIIVSLLKKTRPIHRELGEGGGCCHNGLISILYTRGNNYSTVKYIRNGLGLI